MTGSWKTKERKTQTRMSLDHHQYGMQNTELSLTVCHDVAPAKNKTKKQKKREKHKQECVWIVTNMTCKIHSSVWLSVMMWLQQKNDLWGLRTWGWASLSKPFITHININCILLRLTSVCVCVRLRMLRWAFWVKQSLQPSLQGERG